MATIKRTPISTLPIIDLVGEYRSLKQKIDAAVLRVLAGGSYILGEETKHLEEEVAAYIHVKHAISVNSGTDALLLSLRVLDVSAGDEVIVPAMTFIATAEPVAQLGATPIFADIDPETYTLSPQDVEKKITQKTKAIIPVHLYGQAADMDSLRAIADRHHIPLIEDMAQALGGEYKGKKVGTLGKLACLSFYPTKNLGACGDGGMILAEDDQLASRLQRLRNHGARVKYDHEEIGYNSRLDEIQSAILRVKLPLLNRWNKKRIEFAQEYSKGLSDLPIQLPLTAPQTKHIYHLYSIKTTQRDALRDHLLKDGVQSAMHYPKPLHLQTAFRHLGGKTGDFPHSEALALQTLSLPLYPLLTQSDIQRVIRSVRAFFNRLAT